MSAAILIDVTKCVGCEECVLACKEENDLGPDRLRPGQEAVDGLSATRFSTILRYPDDHFVRQQCRHCLEPACVSACLVGAMQKTPEGPVIYDSDLCMGCRYCLMVCPYGIPRYEWDDTAPLVKKCTLCNHRIVEGREPACVEACPEEALLFGDRDELLAIAHRRIAENPGVYLDHVYGEREVGGTSVLYLSDISLGSLGWAENLGDGDLPHLSYAALKKVPWTILGMGSLMGGVYWVINRRMKLAARAAEGDQISARREEVLSRDPEDTSRTPPLEESEGGRHDE